MSLLSRASRRVPYFFSRLFYLASFLIILREVFHGTRWLRVLTTAFSTVAFPIDESGLGIAVFLGIVGVGLSRRKRVAWWLAVIWLAIWLVTSIGLWATLLHLRGTNQPFDEAVEEQMFTYLINLFGTGALMGVLIAQRKQFAARIVPGHLRNAITTLVTGLAVSLGVGYLLGLVTSHQGRPRSRLANILRYLFDMQGEAPLMVPHWVQLVVGLMIAVTLLGSLFVLLRSQRMQAYMSLDDELHVRRLLAENPEDSLGYFNTRRDKQVVFGANGEGAVAYRVQLGACLAAGDPIGRRDQWAGAIESYLELCHTFGWSPGVVGASEEAAIAYRDAGLHVFRVGDEAVLNPALFDLDAREMKPVRTSVQRLTRAGYQTLIRRHDEIPPAELQHLIALADQWRDGDDRGFSMALNRLGDPLDGQCMMVQAIFPAGSEHAERTAGILSFAPWGPDGLSLDVMRRNPDADNGITEFMVAGLMAAGRDRRIRRVSMNFAVFRSALEEGQRVGATALQRLERRLVMVASHWFQIEQLYRSNVKYGPTWQSRYMAYEDAADIGVIGAAMGVAEGYLDVPGWADPLPVPEQQLVDATDPRVVAFLEQPVIDIAPKHIPEQMRGRLATRQALLDAGEQAYPVLTGVDSHCAQVASGPGATLTIGGRILGVRDHGGVIFVRMQDWSGGTQVLLDARALGRDELRRFSRVTSLGDQIAVTGVAGSSRTGTPSLLVTGWKLISKCLRPLPDKHKGISDPEALVRQRYLDLIVNPATRDRITSRSVAIQAVRQTMLDHRYLEVETPILQTIHGGANARPFRTHINAYDLDLYLRIAPELYLKRLMVGGLDRVFEIGRNFRNEGADATHNPEFTVIEAYEANGTYHTMRDLTVELVRRSAMAANGTTVVRGRGKDGVEHEIDLGEPWAWVPVHEGISRGLGEEVTADTPREELVRHCERLRIDVDPRANRGQVIEELYDVFCEGPTVAPTFFCDFPAEVSPLTRPHRDDPRLAERWDLVVFGSELGTAYSELVDPVIQRQRLTAQSLQAAGGDLEAMELDEDFLTALEYGMPPTGGLGIGLDRLVMLLTEASIRETIAFPLVRPHK